MATSRRTTFRDAKKQPRQLVRTYDHKGGKKCECICANCSIHFDIPMHFWKDGYGKYCSVTCSSKGKKNEAFTREELLGYILRWVEKNQPGETTVRMDLFFQDKTVPSFFTYKRVFKNFGNALKELKLEVFKPAKGRPQPKGDKATNWKGGVRTARGGYKMIYKPGHPNCVSNGYILEHRYVMSQQMGRPLQRWEEVHHKNGIKTDNDPSNLQLVIRWKHWGEICCPHCEKTFLCK